MRVLAVAVALCAAAIVLKDARHWRTGDPRHASFRTVVISVLILLGLSVAAQARPSPYPPVTQFNGDRYGSAQLGPEVVKEAQRQRVDKKLNRRATGAQRKRWKRVPIPRPRMRQVPIFAPLAEPGAVEPLSTDPDASQRVRVVSQQVVGGRPGGCPHRFCGCALALKIFGRIVPVLNLAVNWVHKFQRSPPAPGMVAARHGHAFQLIAHVRGTTWKVWDANSGRGRIRVHERSIAGFVIVNPRSNS